MIAKIRVLFQGIAGNVAASISTNPKDINTQNENISDLSIEMDSSLDSLEKGKN